MRRLIRSIVISCRLRFAKERSSAYTLFLGLGGTAMLRLPTFPHLIMMGAGMGEGTRLSIVWWRSDGKVDDCLSGSTCLHGVLNVRIKTSCPPYHWSHDTIGRGIFGVMPLTNHLCHVVRESRLRTARKPAEQGWKDCAFLFTRSVIVIMSAMARTVIESQLLRAPEWC